MAQTPDEKTYVETPFIEHLKEIGWDYVEGDMPYLTEREGFREVLLAVDHQPVSGGYDGFYCQQYPQQS